MDYGCFCGVDVYILLHRKIDITLISPPINVSWPGKDRKDLLASSQEVVVSYLAVQLMQKVIGSESPRKGFWEGVVLAKPFLGLIVS